MTIDLIGYKCLCVEGFDGFNCEKKSFNQQTNSVSAELPLSSQTTTSTHNHGISSPNSETSELNSAFSISSTLNNQATNQTSVSAELPLSSQTTTSTHNHGISSPNSETSELNSAFSISSTLNNQATNLTSVSAELPLSSQTTTSTHNHGISTQNFQINATDEITTKGSHAESNQIYHLMTFNICFLFFLILHG